MTDTKENMHLGLLLVGYTYQLKGTLSRLIYHILSSVASCFAIIALYCLAAGGDNAKSGKSKEISTKKEMTKRFKISPE